MEYAVLEQLLKTNGLTVYRLAKETGISPTTFSEWKSGRSIPKADKMKRIADYFGVSMSYMMGDGEEIGGEKRIPIIGEIRAGSPIITDQTLLGYETADVAETEEYFYLQVCGDSMKNIGMVDGSLVLFHKQQYAQDGEIVACLVGGDSATVKRFHRSHKNIYLLPENEAYEPIRLTTEDFETGDARILGVAKEVKIKL
jgi:repressor LexA